MEEIENEASDDIGQVEREMENATPVVEQHSTQDERAAHEIGEAGEEFTEPDTDVEQVGSQLETAGTSGEEKKSPAMNLERILDIELPVNISFGLARRPLSEVLKLGPGALLELDRAVDEPVVVKVNNKVFARGEIVDVDGFYGVQITEIANTSDRIASLGGED